MNHKKRYSLLLTAATLALTAFTALPLAQTSVTVDLSARRQIIRGFGGMEITWNPNGLLSSANRQLVFGNEPHQLGFTIMRIYLGVNQTEWNQTLNIAKWASDNGVLVFASPWHPPQNMRETMTRPSDGRRYYRLNPSSYAAYVQHINAFVEFMYSNGVNLYAVSIQNEPDYGINDYSDDGWCVWTQEEMVNFMRDHAGNIDPRVKVISPETFQYEAWSSNSGRDKPMFTAMLNDAGARANIDIFGTHFYGVYRPNLSEPSTPFEWPRFEEIGRPAGKELWMTEVYTPNNHDGNIWDAADDGDAMRTARMIHYSKVAGGFSAWVWWYTHRFYSVLHDGQGHSGTTPLGANGTITKRGWITAQYSKFVRPGFHRVETTPSRIGANDNNRVLLSAYSGDDGTVVIVAVNMNTAASSVNFNISGASGLSSMEVYRTSQNENVAKQTDINVSGNAFSASLPGRSVTTFVGGGIPVVIEPDENGYWFRDPFESDTHDWTGRGGDTRVETSGRTRAVGDESLAIRDRGAAWHGATKNLPAGFVAGETYSFSVCAVYLDDGADVETLKLTFEYTDATDTTRWLSIAELDAARGQWVQLHNPNFTIPSGATNMRIIVESPSNDSITLYIDEAIGAVGGTDIAAPEGVSTEGATSVRVLSGNRHVRPLVAVRGRTLSVSSPNNNEVLTIRMIDVRGRVRATFNVADGSARIALSRTRVPAGRYFVDVRGAGVRQTLPVVVK